MTHTTSDPTTPLPTEEAVAETARSIARLVAEIADLTAHREAVRTVGLPTTLQSIRNAMQRRLGMAIDAKRRGLDEAAAELSNQRRLLERGGDEETWLDRGDERLRTYRARLRALRAALADLPEVPSGSHAAGLRERYDYNCFEGAGAVRSREVQALTAFIERVIAEDPGVATSEGSSGV